MDDPATAPAPFPVCLWSGRRATFEPGRGAPPGEVARAVIVFARAACGYVLADIPGRGWTVPSGHVEPTETPTDAAVRETYEEIGAAICSPERIGRYVLIEPDGARLEFPTFIAPVEEYGALPSASESRAVRCFPLDEIPRIYWFWDDLLASVFRYADACLNRRAMGNTNA